MSTSDLTQLAVTVAQRQVSLQLAVTDYVAASYPEIPATRRDITMSWLDVCCKALADAQVSYDLALRKQEPT